MSANPPNTIYTSAQAQSAAKAAGELPGALPWKVPFLTKSQGKGSASQIGSASQHTP